MKLRFLEKYVLLASCILISLSAQGQSKTFEKAQQRAAAFFERHVPKDIKLSHAVQYSQMDATVIWNSTSLQVERHDKSRAKNSAEEPTFYMFKGASGKGFAIISGDDIDRPIIGYSLENNPSDSQSIPENMREYLLDIDQQIHTFRVTNATPSKIGPETDPSAYGHIVKYIPTAEWGQGAPYNEQCFDPQGQKCITGCVPTAFVIVFRHHKWPLSGNGEVQNNGLWGTTKRDISNHIYNWEQMPLKYTEGKYTPTEAKEVAQIMYDVGCACPVEYGPNITGGNISTNMVKNIQSHFSYKDAHFAQKGMGKYTSDKQWTDAIKANLEAGLPIPYAATRNKNEASTDAKHMFVLDGYTDKDYYHFNWGWNGSNNGYYTLSSMYPNSQGAYINSHKAVFNFTPNRKEQVFRISVSSSGNGLAYIGSQRDTSKLVIQGTSVILHAIPAFGYEFDSWTTDGTIVPNAGATHSITAIKDAEYVANFKKSQSVDSYAYYSIHFFERRVLLTDNTDGTVSALAKDENLKYSQLWAFIPIEGSEGKFYIQSKLGNYLKFPQKRGDEVITTPNKAEADKFINMLTKDYDRFQEVVFEGSHLLVKDHKERYCLEESGESPGKVIAFNQPYEYTELHFVKEEEGSTGISTEIMLQSTQSPIYDLQGRSVSRPISGNIYIQNGEKFIAD